MINTILNDTLFAAAGNLFIKNILIPEPTMHKVGEIEM